MEVYLHTTFLTLELDGGEWSASHTSHFTARERAPGTHWTRGWVCLRDRLARHRHKEEKNPSPILLRIVSWSSSLKQSEYSD